MFFIYYCGLTQPRQREAAAVIKEQVLANKLVVGLLTRGPVP